MLTNVVSSLLCPVRTAIGFAQLKHQLELCSEAQLREHAQMEQCEWWDKQPSADATQAKHTGSGHWTDKPGAIRQTVHTQTGPHSASWLVTYALRIISRCCILPRFAHT